MQYLIRHVHENPFAAQFIRQYNRPRKQQGQALLALFFSACLVGLNYLTPPVSRPVLSALYYSMRRMPPPFAWRMVDSLAGFVTTLALVLLIPPVAASRAATLVSRHIGTANFQEIRMTLLGERSIVQAYVYAALVRMPIVIALAVGLCISLLVRFPFNIPRFPYDQLSQLLFVLMRASSIVAILVRLWLAVTVGVALALWLRRSPFWAGLCSMGVTLVITLAMMTVQSLLRARLQFPFTGLLTPLSNYSVKGILIFDILNGLAWTGVAAGLAAISVRWAKRGASLQPR